MDFYRILSRYYDEIFPTKEQQKAFLQDYLKRNRIRTLLDVGCGTGSYVLELNSRGIKAAGVDLSEAMVDAARAKAKAMGSSANFSRGDMLELESLPGTFDAVMCIGNTLAHLAQPGQLQEALAQFAAKGCHLLIQLVNYDRILAQNITSLPQIKTPALIFRRHYEHLPGGKLKFTTEIQLAGQDHTFTEVNTLRAITKGELDGALGLTGWKAANWWGDFGFTPWSEEAPATIVEAKYVVK